MSLVNFKTPSGQRREGMASFYLRNLPEESTLYCIHQKKDLLDKMIHNQDKPIVMVANGSGIAPMRGMWQRKSECRHNNFTLIFFTLYQLIKLTTLLGGFKQMSLYFGCRNFDEDLFAKETDILGIDRKTALC